MTDAEILAANQAFADRWFGDRAWKARWVEVRTSQCIADRDLQARAQRLEAWYEDWKQRGRPWLDGEVIPS